MVASPNVDFGGANGLANFLQDQQRQIDELGRRSTYPFSAGPGGTIQVYPDPSIKDVNGQPVVDTVMKFDTGIAALSIKPGIAAYGSKQQMTMRDLSGYVMYRTDESAGYGLAQPSMNYQMTGIESAGPNLPTSAATAVTVALGASPIYNPVWYVECRIRFVVGANPLNATATLKITGGDGVTYTSNPLAITSPVNSYALPLLSKMILLPAACMGTRCTAEVNVYVAPGDTTTTVQGFPTFSSGIAKASYDQNPNFH
jgi:hypothetical protein